MKKLDSKILHPNEKSCGLANALPEKYEWDESSFWNQHFGCTPPEVTNEEIEHICKGVDFDSSSSDSTQTLADLTATCIKTLETMFKKQGTVWNFEKTA